MLAGLALVDVRLAGRAALVDDGEAQSLPLQGQFEGEPPARAARRGVPDRVRGELVGAELEVVRVETAQLGTFVVYGPHVLPGGPR